MKRNHFFQRNGCLCGLVVVACSGQKETSEQVRKKMFQLVEIAKVMEQDCSAGRFIYSSVRNPIRLIRLVRLSPMYQKNICRKSVIKSMPDKNW